MLAFNIKRLGVLNLSKNSMAAGKKVKICEINLQTDVLHN